MNLLLLWRVFSSPLARDSVLEPISKTTQVGCSFLKKKDEQGLLIGSYVAVNWTNFHISPHCVITTGTRGLFCPSVGMFSTFLTISIPSSITWKEIIPRNYSLKLGCKPTKPFCRFLSVFVGILSVFPRRQKPTNLFWETDKYIGFCRFSSVFLSVLGPHFMVFSLNFPKFYLSRNFFCKVNRLLFHLDTFFIMIVECKT